MPVISGLSGSGVRYLLGEPADRDNTSSLVQRMSIGDLVWQSDAPLLHRISRASPLVALVDGDLRLAVCPEHMVQAFAHERR